MPEGSSSLSLAQRLISEIEELRTQQIDALRSATFIGMTGQEAEAFRERGTRIGALIEELKALTSRRAA